jgi:2'-5' RNA ligase
MRVFVAVELPEKIKNQIAVVQSELKKTQAQVSWVKPGNIHVTLKFLGEVGEEKMKEVFIAAERGGKGTKKFRMSLKGLGGFPNLNRPRVIWVGTASGEKELCELQGRVETELEKVGFSRDDRKFSAHFTLGRARFPNGLEGLAEKVEKTEFSSPEFTVEQVVVMQSQLNPAGSIYTPLKKIPLED